MNCEEVVELMQRYLDHDLGEPEYQAMIEHIQTCRTCSVMFEQFKRLSNELEHLPQVSPQVSLVDLILPQLEQLDRQKSAEVNEDSGLPGSRSNLAQANGRREKWWNNGSYRVLGGVVAAGIVLGLFIFNQPPATDYKMASEQSISANDARKSVSADSSANSANSANPANSAENRAFSQENMPMADRNPSSMSMGQEDLNKVKTEDQAGAVTDGPKESIKAPKMATPAESAGGSDSAPEENRMTLNLFMAEAPVAGVPSADQNYTAEVEQPTDGNQQIVIRDKDHLEVFASSIYQAEQIINLQWSEDGNKLEFDAVLNQTLTHVTLDIANKTETRD